MIALEKIHVNLYDILSCLSETQDLVSSRLANHNQQVAYLSFRIAQQLKLSVEHQYEVFLAGLIHDIGALSKKEKLELIETEPLTINSHAFRGARLVGGFLPLANSAKIIKFHHLPWNKGSGLEYQGEEVPLASHIIHVADRVCILIKQEHNILTQLPDILTKIRERSDTHFKPELVDALFELSSLEYVWLDLVSHSPTQGIPTSGFLNSLTLEIDDLIDLGLMFSRIIDFRSHYTAKHSAGVAKTAQRLAQLAGFSPIECKMMLVAGYLHDLGKLAISDEVLEKTTKLSEDEFNEMRAHTYYTYRLLEPLKPLEIINVWASFHHEKLNGRGYPFHLTDDNLPSGSRIMAVADVFAAITENRPYREGMDYDNTKKVLSGMVANNSLDGRFVEILLDNFLELDSIRQVAQHEAATEYKAFMQL